MARNSLVCADVPQSKYMYSLNDAHEAVLLLVADKTLLVLTFFFVATKSFLFSKK